VADHGAQIWMLRAPVDVVGRLHRHPAPTAGRAQISDPERVGR
jgi:hypothetical protein